MNKLFTLISCLRPKHYIKNVLAFVALLTSGLLFTVSKLITVTLGFIAFCCIASVVYIVNDIKDKEKDRLHPTKKNRPIANGSVSVTQASVIAIILFFIALFISVGVGNLGAGLLLGFYLLLNLLYSSGLKNIPIVDITILASGFVIRVLYGALLAGVEASSWLYLTIFSLSFFFALGKRRNELGGGSSKTRSVLAAYNKGFLDKYMYVCLTLANAFYSLWSVSGPTGSFFANKYLIFTVPLVMLITMRYCLDVEGNSDGDPVEVLVHDKILIGLTGFYVLFLVGILYGFSFVGMVVH